MALYLYDDPGALYDTATYDSLVLVPVVGQPLVELFLNSVWTNVTVFTRMSDGIRIQRGRSDESQAPTPATCTLTFDNTDGRFTPSYTTGAYYPYVMRNTQLRVSVLLDDLVTYSVRFWGEISEWPLAYDHSVRDVTVSVTGSGPRRKYARTQVPLAPAYTTAMATQTAVLGYWPMEDGASATTFANAVASGSPGGYAGSVALASDSTWAASAPLPVFSGTTETATFTVPAYTPAASGQQVRFWAKVPLVATSGTFTVLISTTGAHYFQFDYDSVGGSGNLYMKNVTTGVVEGTNGPFALGPWFKPGGRFSIDLKQNGTGIDCNMHGYRPGDSTGFVFGVVTIPSSTLGFITGVGMLNTGADVVSTFGQLSVENHVTSQFDLGLAVLNAFNGEAAYDRAVRLIPALGAVINAFTGTGSEALGVQESATPLDLFDEAAFVDGGLSTEAVEFDVLEWRARTSLLSLPATVTLDLTRATDLRQVTDDQGTQNDVTVNRVNGASARRVATSGLTPAAVGTYAAGYDLSLNLDSQTGPQAEWRLAVGSLDLPRYPVVAFDAVSGLTSELRTSLVALREGFTLALTATASAAIGLPASSPLRVLGWSETFTPGQWLWEINATHGPPFTDVFILDSATYGVLDTNRLGM